MDLIGTTTVTVSGTITGGAGGAGGTGAAGNNDNVSVGGAGGAAAIGGIGIEALTTTGGTITIKSGGEVKGGAGGAGGDGGAANATDGDGGAGAAGTTGGAGVDVTVAVTLDVEAGGKVTGGAAGATGNDGAEGASSNAESTISTAGTGGDAVNADNAITLTNVGTITGGAGGTGTDSNQTNIIGNRGGDGGEGVDLNAVSTVTNTGSITGGAGGNDGNANTSTLVFIERGGNGGVGLSFDNASTVTNNTGGSITGGAAGTGVNGGTGGASGIGGIGGTGLTSTAAGTINNTGGTLTGGKGGTGGLGNATASTDTGGAGGGGGAGVNIQTTALAGFDNTGGTIRGGVGGTAGAAQNASANGGIGGAGGIGLAISIASTLTNDGTIVGGAGANGGDGGASGTGGAGGTGGTAVQATVATTFTNNGTLTAGSVGSGGSGGTAGAAGSAGSAFSGSQATTFTNTGTITGNIVLGTAVDTFNMNGGTITGNIDLATGANVASATKGTINGVFDIGAATADATINPSSGNTVSFLNSGGTALESTGLDFALSGAGTVVINGNVVDTSASATDIDQTAGTLEFAGNSAIDGALLSSGASTIVDLSTNDVTVAAASTLGTSGSTLKVTIDNTAGSSGSLATSAAVAITVNDSLIISPTLGTVTSGSTITIIDGAAGGGTLSTTTLATLQSNLVDNNARFDFTLANTGQTLTITTDKASSSSLNLSDSASGVNDVADTAFASDSTLLTALNGVSSASELNDALETLAPTVDGGAIVGSVSAGTASRKVVQTRMANLRIGISAGQGLASGDEYEGERSFWTQGFGSYADQKDRDGFDGFDAVTGGFALGADRPFTRNLTAGLAFSYAFTNVSSDSSANQTQINSFQATGYGSYELGSYFLESMVSLAYNTYEGLRSISVGSVERRARADYDGGQSSIKAGLGREFRFDNNIEITPSISLQYNHVYIDSYKESGADASNLNVSSQNYDSLYLTFNSEFSRTYEIDVGTLAFIYSDVGAGTLTPEFHIGYMYEALDEQVATTSTFTGGGGSFKTSGFDPANHSLLVGVGLAFASMDNFDLKATYDMEAKDDYISHSALIRGEWKF